MERLTYALKNIRLTARGHGVLFLALIVSQTAAVLGVLLSIGFITNSIRQKKQTELDKRFFSYYFFTEDETYDEETGSVVTVDRNDPTIMFAPRYSALKEKTAELIDFCGEDFSGLYLSCGVIDEGREKTISTFFGVDEDSEVFTNAANSERPVAVAAAGEFSREDISGALKEGDRVTLLGESFEVIACEEQMSTDFVIPNRFLPDEAQVNIIQLTLSDQPTELRAQEIENKFYSLFGRADFFKKPETADLVQEQTSNMYIGVSVIIMVTVMLNISLYYKYILDMRTGQMSILRICGASGRDIFITLTLEMCFEYILSFALSAAAFGAMLGRLRESFPAFCVYDDGRLFYIIAGAFLLTSTAVSAAVARPYAKMSPAEALRERKE